MKGLFLKCLLALTAFLAAGSSGSGQAAPAGIGPGSYISIGATFSGYESDYGKRKVGGASLFLDANLYRRIGAEAEFRDLNLHTDEGVRERTYLAGPKISALAYGFRPYAKLLAGRGDFDFPFGYARGSYFVLAPGSGLDLQLRRSRFMVRVVDFEYQLWPQFTFGALHPYGLSSGVSLRLF